MHNYRQLTCMDWLKTQLILIHGLEWITFCQSQAIDATKSCSAESKYIFCLICRPLHTGIVQSCLVSWLCLCLLSFGLCGARMFSRVSHDVFFSIYIHSSVINLSHAGCCSSSLPLVYSWLMFSLIYLLFMHFGILMIMEIKLSMSI